MSAVALICHPETPCAVARSVTVAVSRSSAGGLLFRYVLEGDLANIRLPAPRPPRHTHRLWEHTCFEAFIRAGDAPDYLEFNFAPSGEWAAYAFRKYREGKALSADMFPGIQVRQHGDRLELDGSIAADSLPERRALRLGISAVIEAADGTLSYWAVRHAPGRPDFHHADAFALDAPHLVQTD